MRQQVEVKSVSPDGYAQVAAIRRSACSGDCHKCSGCGAVVQEVQVRAKNRIGAVPGDQVIVETGTGAVFSALLIVYMLPLVLLLIGYFVGYVLGILPGLFSLVGFVLGIVVILFYNRYVTRRKQMEFTITSFAF